MRLGHLKVQPNQSVPSMRPQSSKVKCVTADASRCNGRLVLAKCRDNEEGVQGKLQVRRVDQTRYPMIVVASLSAVPQSCRTSLLL